jgi:ketosteroid isomerase-like protein
MKLTVKRLVHSDNIALMISEWAMTGTGPDGKALQMGGRASDVLRRQPDGTWRVVIDNPMGTT